MVHSESPGFIEFPASTEGHAQALSTEGIVLRLGSAALYCTGFFVLLIFFSPRMSVQGDVYAGVEFRNGVPGCPRCYHFDGGATSTGLWENCPHIRRT